MNKFIPKVLLIGDENEIPKDVPEYEIVGKLEFRQLEPEILQIVLDGELLSESKLKSLDFDYLLFTRGDLYGRNKHIWTRIMPLGTIATVAYFKNFVSNVCFVADKNIGELYKLLTKDKQKSPKQILDLDAYFYHANSFDFLNRYLPAPPPRNCFKSRLSSKILPKSNLSSTMCMNRSSRHSMKLNSGAMTR